jgi:predicted SprT family Zn-dependent metalloprotease
MNLHDANILARRTMDAHGLDDWGIRWDNAKRRAGLCSYSTRTLSFSKSITAFNHEQSFMETLLHEIAHAMVGSGHGHDSVWRRQCIAIGGTGARCSSKDEVPPAPFTGIHDGRNGCTQTFPRHRRPKGTVFCPKCYRRSPSGGLQALDALLGAGTDNSAAQIRWVRTSDLAAKSAADQA